MSKKEKELQFPYVVQSQYEHRTVTATRPQGWSKFFMQNNLGFSFSRHSSSHTHTHTPHKPFLHLNTKIRIYIFWWYLVLFSDNKYLTNWTCIYKKTKKNEVHTACHIIQNIFACLNSICVLFKIWSAVIHKANTPICNKSILS